MPRAPPTVELVSDVLVGVSENDVEDVWWKTGKIEVARILPPPPTVSVSLVELGVKDVVSVSVWVSEVEVSVCDSV
jgi:hypothetical protein